MARKSTKLNGVLPLRRGGLETHESVIRNALVPEQMESFLLLLSQTS
jgi:hypothetical protein